MSTPAMTADVVVADAPSIVSGESVYDWSGFYVGAGGGYGAVVHELSSPIFGGVTFNGIGGEGFFGEITAGYDFQFSNGVVAGVAASGRYGNIGTSLDVFGLNADLNAEYGFDIVGRLGYTVAPNTLAYVLGGYTWQHFDLSTNFGFGTDWNSGGYVLGLGMEHVLRGKWTLKSEYRYAKYNSQDFFGGGLSVDPSTHTFHTTLNYRFNGGPSGTTASPVNYDWTGIKVGLAAGGGAIVHDTDLFGSIIDFDGFGSEGFLGDINVGYDREIGNGYLIGGVLAARISNMELETTAPGFSNSLQAEYGFDALLRFGKLFNSRTLAYVIGGYTYEHFDYSTSGGGSADWNLGGYTLGTGMEVAFTDRITGYTEYRFSHFGSEDFGTGGLIEIGPSSHTVRVGAKFKLY
ncbi:outer membrane protein [Hoeflea prorocentri]|uniref:Outer membrane beta-barrel protein n=1 Tax=Hoeflea prorocentri TaxID=1922333 RepID=A0A9X3UMM7_9HYPH|nr:outer membrane beta-barrel protein [Hoeflea prorocentri]MCY6381994.1 outer membrane beta-barrel protein [Hoeflea prorocentri]MDA5399794.1 outer membrane beta-barrel protein [Hoeflea prorocentri]